MIHSANWVTEVSFLPAPFNVININTLIMTWAAMGVILLISLWLTRGVSVRPTGRQVVAEGVFGLCRSITMQTGGHRGDQFLFYIGSLFIFILTANLMGQLPLRLIQLSQGELIAATGDFNTTAALGVFTLAMYLYFGIKTKGLRYFSHYVKPFIFFLPVNITEDVTRPFSLMLRLYANIMVGEILSSIALQIIPIGVPILVILLELFVACLQAYIFAILSSAYITILSDDHH